MQTPKTPANEMSRLKKLKSLNLLDSEANERLDSLVGLAASICDTPIALISLVDSNRQWFKSKIGLEANETPRDISFCGHAINQFEILEVENAAEDERFWDNPLVVGDPNIKFYAGKTLSSSDGFNIGTLCVIDRKPKKLTELQKEQLTIISDQIMACIEDREEISRLKDDVNSKAAFVASMSHEIRTPLTSVIGFADVLTDLVASQDFDKDKVLQTANIIKSSSEHLVELVGDILDFSKLEARKYLIKNETYSLSKSLKQIYNTLKIQAEKYDTKFSIQQSMLTPEYIFGDKTLLKQVIINLGGNALKFSNGESVEIQVNLSRCEQLIIVDVVDTGVGMTEEEAARVFRPFVQANGNIAKKFDGTGLGLSISKEIIELMDGTISLVKTEKGVGSHFQISFPFIEKHEDDLTKIVQAEVSDDSHSDINGKKVLIVDDVKENRYLLRHYLKDFELDFKDAASGKDAINKFDTSYDYIFLDMQLPDMEGIEVFNSLREKVQSHQKIIAFTASSTSSGIEECMKIGFSGYLTKPFDSKSVLESIQNTYQ